MAAALSTGRPGTYRSMNQCLPDFLIAPPTRFPDKTAFNFQGLPDQLHPTQGHGRPVRHRLHRFGIRKGDAVAHLLPNMIPCVAAYYAITAWAPSPS
jgi:long-chain acyl-CoA synthetase